MQKLEQLINLKKKNIYIHCVAPRIDMFIKKHYQKIILNINLIIF